MKHTRRFRIRTVAVAGCAALTWTLLAAVSAPTAAAAFWPAGVDFWVNSGMGPIKTRIFRARDGNTQRVAYALDGMRARDDLNGWEIETDIAQRLTAANINVVMPVGGQSGFYTDWQCPSNFNGQRVAYKWETFLTRELPTALRTRLNFASARNGIFGLSMGGSAAMVLAAYHPRQFSFAASMSGFLNLSAPGMPEAIRTAMLDVGRFNVDCMWGPPWSAQWRRNDPFVAAPLLRAHHTRLFVATGNGVPSAVDAPGDLLGVWRVVAGMTLESMAFANTVSFRNRLADLHYGNVVYDFPPVGVHSWTHWRTAANVMVPELSRSIG